MTKDTWQGDLITPLTLNKWNYTGSNPITRKDPTGNWYCTGHPDCTDWVNNVISKLSVSGSAGQKINQFFVNYDTKIMSMQDAYIKKWTSVADKYDPCFTSHHKAGGLHFEFTDSPFPGGLANTFDEQKVQFLKTEFISGSNPTNWGVITFAHEISHYKQGVERFTIQGEMFAQYAGGQVWKDLGEVAIDMPYQLFWEFLSVSLGGHPEEYNPFITININPQPLQGNIMDNHGLMKARAKLAAESNPFYNLFPLYFVGLDEAWFRDLGIDWYKSIIYK